MTPDCPSNFQEVNFHTLQNGLALVLIQFCAPRQAIVPGRQVYTFLNKKGPTGHRTSFLFYCIGGI